MARCPTPAQIDRALARSSSCVDAAIERTHHGIQAVPVIGHGWQQLRFDAGPCVDPIIDIPAGCMSAAQLRRFNEIIDRASGAQTGITSGGTSWSELVKKIAVGAAGVLLILLGLAIMGGQLTIEQAASRFGKAISSAAKGGK